MNSHSQQQGQRQARRGVWRAGWGRGVLCPSAGERTVPYTEKGEEGKQRNQFCSTLRQRTPRTADIEKPYLRVHTTPSSFHRNSSENQKLFFFLKKQFSQEPNFCWYRIEQTPSLTGAQPTAPRADCVLTEESRQRHRQREGCLKAGL